MIFDYLPSTDLQAGVGGSPLKSAEVLGSVARGSSLGSALPMVCQQSAEVDLVLAGNGSQVWSPWFGSPG